MAQKFLTIWKQARDFLERFLKRSLVRTVTLAYSLISIPFFVYHEFHLPFEYIFVLTALTWVVGVGLLFVCFYVIPVYWKEPFHPFLELFALCFFLFGLWISEVLAFRSGRVFLFLLFSLLVFIRILRIETFAKIAFAGLLISGNALLTFRSMQGFEILGSYVLYKNKYPFPEVESMEWKEIEKGTYWNPGISFGFKLTEESYFFTPESLGLENKTGIGQIAGIIGSSDSDPNRYPSIKIFFLPDFIHFSKEDAYKEMSEYLKTKISKQEIEDIQEIASNESLVNNVGFKYWTFYDTLRPRYAKTGFILIETQNHDNILLQITENLEKGKEHEPLIEEILKSIFFFDPTQSNQ